VGEEVVDALLRSVYNLPCCLNRFRAVEVSDAMGLCCWPVLRHDFFPALPPALRKTRAGRSERAYLERIQIRRRAHGVSREHLGLLKLLQRNLLDLVRHGAQKLVGSVDSVD
jgi:hypothetical protein